MNTVVCADFATAIAVNKENGSPKNLRFALLFGLLGRWFAHDQPDRAATNAAQPADPLGPRIALRLGGLANYGPS